MLALFPKLVVEQLQQPLLGCKRAKGFQDSVKNPPLMAGFLHLCAVGFRHLLAVIDLFFEWHQCQSRSKFF